MTDDIKSSIITKLFDSDKKIKIYDNNKEYVGEINHCILISISDYYKKFVSNDFSDDKEKLILPFSNKLIKLFMEYLNYVKNNLLPKDDNYDSGYWSDRKINNYTEEDVLEYSKIIYLFDYLLINDSFVGDFKNKYMDDLKYVGHDYNVDFCHAIDPVIILYYNDNEKFSDNYLKIIEQSSRPYSKIPYIYFGSLFYLDHHKYLELSDYYRLMGKNHFAIIKYLFDIFFNIETIYHRIISEEYIMMCWMNIFGMLPKLFAIDRQIYKYFLSIQNDKYRSILSKIDPIDKKNYESLLQLDCLPEYRKLYISYHSSIQKNFTHYIDNDMYLLIKINGGHLTITSDFANNMAIKINCQYRKNNQIKEIFSEILPINVNLYTKCKSVDIDNIDLLIIDIVCVKEKGNIDYRKLKEDFINEINTIEDYKTIFEKTNNFFQKINNYIDEKENNIINFPDADKQMFRKKYFKKENKLLNIISLGLFYELNIFKEKYQNIKIFDKCSGDDYRYLPSEIKRQYLKYYLAHNSINYSDAFIKNIDGCLHDVPADIDDDVDDHADNVDNVDHQDNRSENIHSYTDDDDNFSDNEYIMDDF